MIGCFVIIKKGEIIEPIDFDDTKTLTLSLLINLIKCFKDNNEYTFIQFINEHLNNFLMFKFESLSIGFESLKATFQISNGSSKNEVSDSNHYSSDSNPNSNKTSQIKVIRIPQNRIRITLSESAN